MNIKDKFICTRNLQIFNKMKKKNYYIYKDLVNLTKYDT